MSKELDLNAPYSKEEYTKIGTAIGLLDTMVLKLEHETSEGQKLLDNVGDNQFSNEMVIAFQFAFGIDLNEMRTKTKEKILSNHKEIERIKMIREDVLNDKKTLLKIANFIDIIYQPNQD